MCDALGTETDEVERAHGLLTMRFRAGGTEGAEAAGVLGTGCQGFFDVGVYVEVETFVAVGTVA